MLNSGEDAISKVLGVVDYAEVKIFVRLTGGKDNARFHCLGLDEISFKDRIVTYYF